MRLRRVEGQKHRLFSQNDFVFGSVWYVTEWILPVRQAHDHLRQAHDDLG